MDNYEEKLHVKKEVIKRLKHNEPLTSKMLEIALNSIEICWQRNRNGSDGEDDFSKLLYNIGAKMISGQALDNYEIYVMGDLISSMDYEERKKARKSDGARYGHITRRLKRSEPLKGKTLELAIDLVAVNGDDEQSKFIRNIGVKMKKGRPLDEYEYHIVVDVLMRHAKLAF